MCIRDSIITSLWKAEDKTTSYITQKLHYYLDKGYTTDKALQKAKLDLLNDTEIDPRYKSPDYWAHLLFIGNYEKGKVSQDFKWFALILDVYKRQTLSKVNRPVLFP